MPTERPPLLSEVVPTFADRACCVVSATDPPGRILGFLDRSRCYSSVILTSTHEELREIGWGGMDWIHLDRDQ
jgi:hypothetical protein